MVAHCLVWAASKRNSDSNHAKKSRGALPRRRTDRLSRFGKGRCMVALREQSCRHGSPALPLPRRRSAAAALGRDHRRSLWADAAQQRLLRHAVRLHTHGIAVAVVFTLVPLSLQAAHVTSRACGIVCTLVASFRQRTLSSTLWHATSTRHLRPSSLSALKSVSLCFACLT